VDSRKIFDRLFAQVEVPAFKVVYWTGDEVRYGSGQEPAFVLHLKNREVCESIFLNPDLRFGEAYMGGAIDIEGDLRELVRLVFDNRFKDFEIGTLEKAKIAAMALKQRNSISQARKNIAHHYDLGNDFFNLWLGKERAYSCAYFANASDDLDRAQEQKFSHICKKLHFRPGERYLDIGCGWGGLAIHAAKHHGAEVLGITLSEEQMHGARQRVKAAGLEGRVRIELMDYREVSEEPFDKLTSVGMLEHVGQENIPTYIECTSQLLRPGGLSILHSIGRMVSQPTHPWITKYIFPGMYLPSLSDMATPMGELGLDIIDVEVMRRHYAMTLDLWSDAFEAHVDEIREMHDEAFVRMWRLYLACCSTSFRYGNLTLWQIQFSRGLNNELPLTRDYLYR
jgi:cyclopropane-fatty-acyl-phospholipid synthase